MESLVGIHHRHRLPFSRPKTSSLATTTTTKPLTLAFKSTTNLSIKSSSSSQNPPPTNPPRLKTLPDTLFSRLKPAFVTLIATSAAALLSSRLQNRSPFLSHAAVPPPPQSETLPKEKEFTDEEKEWILEGRVKSNPDDALSLQALMELKIKAQKLQEAILILDRLILLEPNDKELPLLKAHLWNYAGDTVAARADFEEIIRKDPFVVEAYHGLVMLAEQAESSSSGGEGELGWVVERIESVMETCEKEKRKETLRDFNLLVAQIRVMEGEYERALGVYRQLVSEEPRDFRPYLCQGIIYTLMQKKDEAEKQFEKYRLLVPKEHPYAEYFDENMATMMGLGQMQESKRTGALRR